MAFNTIDWAYALRRQLRSEIRKLSRSGGADIDYEAIGLLGETDRLRDLKRRLGQVERLIDAIGEPPPAEEGENAPFRGRTAPDHAPEAALRPFATPN